MPPSASLIFAPDTSFRHDIRESLWDATTILMHRAAAEDEGLGAKLSVMSIIFVVSLFAASFPTLSRRVRFLRIPRIVFFIGKHFGTGVILSTAFVHLLQDAFEALAKSGRIGDFTGIIVLASLLTIFLIEYISTAYVDTLQSYSSPPSTPTSPQSRFPGSSATITPPAESSDIAAQGLYILPESPAPRDEHTPLLQPPASQPRPQLSQTLPCSSRPPPTSSRPKGMLTPNQSQSNSYFPSRRDSYYRRSQHSHSHTGVEADIFEGGHHRHEPRSHHASHVTDRRRSFMAGQLEEELSRDREAEEARKVDEESVRDEPQQNGRHHHHQHQNGHGGHGAGHAGHSHAIGWESDDEFEHGMDEEGHGVIVGQKRVVVGILVLQLGIMIHSLVIGLTLAITSGGGFTSLVFAIIFHQLFEGLSLGIRIAQLPTSASHAHQHKNGNDDHDHGDHKPYLRFLKPTLMALFALTTPLGILLGILLFSSPSTSSPSDPQSSLTLIRGIMCAVSAGMLIYAATVEMLAADFVMDPASWRAGVRRQVVAIGSLVAGAVGMSLVGMMD
ncbi:Zinc/iron permease [Heliocybe sulcata]|uniref:Zinc/iron permease n=1 Tax=Heliocybe sulcata TaxID=5364 RepID=A0A5C3NCD1_9AGAM|nr:Zinc/iron permease [Heliocybe sulcata]